MPDNCTILFLGDIMGRPGRRVVEEYLPVLKKKCSPDLIIANGENAAGGIGITEKVGTQLLRNIDFLTSGNHIWDKKDALTYLLEEPRVIRPANYPEPCPGRTFAIAQVRSGAKIGILNLQGRVFMEPVECPFRTADDALNTIRQQTPVIIVDFHAEATSEKQALGWYLDGRVSAVVGTHTHVPTADERILPNGTAYISDVGMVGGYNSVIGIRREQAIQRFLTSRPQRFEPSQDGCILAAVCIKVDIDSGKALSISRETIIEEECDG